MTDPTEPIGIDDLIVTQKAVRAPKSLKELIRYASSGGKFTGILVFHFPEDGKYFLHDGHHRYKL